MTPNQIYMILLAANIDLIKIAEDIGDIYQHSHRLESSTIVI